MKALKILTACALAAGSVLVATSPAHATTNANEKIAFDYFVSHGFTDIQAAGIVGNLMIESSVNPAIAQANGGPGRGIAQWSVGDRWDTANPNVVSYAAGTDRSRYDLDAQLDFIMLEFKEHPEFGYQDVRNSTTIGAATYEFGHKYERCGKCAYSIRTSAANDAYEAFHGTAPKTIENSDFDGDAQSDVFNSSAGVWRYKSAASGDWIKLRDSDAKVSDGDLRLGDFDGDGKADVLMTLSSGWFVSHDGTGAWKKISDSTVPASQLMIGDFNGDGKSDIFNSSAGVWRYKSAGSSDWIKLRDSDATVSDGDLRLGDFDGDGKADVLMTLSSGWFVSHDGTGAWKQISDSTVPAGQLLVGDFNADGKSDIFNSSAGVWRYKSAGSSDWIKLRDSDATVPGNHLRLGDFDGDGKADVMMTLSSGWYVSFAGTSRWYDHDSSTTSANQTLISYGLPTYNQ